MKYITVSIFIFFCLGQTLVAQNKISREEISSLVGSALGAISSKSCGNKIKFADKIYRKYTNMLSYSVKKGQLSTQQKNDLVKIIIRFRVDDSALRHNSKVCKSAERLLNNINRKLK